MESESDRRKGRRQQIGDRIVAIRTRIDELQQAAQTGKYPVSSTGQLIEAQHYAAASEAAAQRALAASIDALRRAGEAHERLAAQYQQAATTGGGEEDRRERAAFHHAAAATDRQRADTAETLLTSRGDSQDG